MSVVFLKENEGKFKKVSNLDEADYVRLPALIYREYFENSENDDTVQIPKSEYYGYLKMLRIIRDRECQQIDKEKADSHGYTTKYVDERIYDRSNPDIKAFYITKTTPVSLKIDLSTAYVLIKSDLKEFYSFMEEQVFISKEGIQKKITTIDMLTAVKQKKDENYYRDYYVTNSDYGRALKELVDSLEEMTFGPIQLSCNFSQGVYDIKYYGTAPI